jgi:5-methylcytosine-specific restriction protein B
MADDALGELSKAIAQGAKFKGDMRPLIEALFGERYNKRHLEKTSIRDAFGLSTDEGVPYAGLINPDNPPSGPYGGTSVVWFPGPDGGALIDFGIGTRGLAPDEGILTRPGHRRRITALRRLLASRKVPAWSKPDPAALTVEVPKTARAEFPGFESVFKRYGNELYVCAHVPADNPEKARSIVQAFVDLYAIERGWNVLKAAQDEVDALHASLRDELWKMPTMAEIHELLRERRFVVLQGPPGTGKTRLADELRKKHFEGSPPTIQFHPAVTYEDFVVGLAPDASKESLHFDVRAGWLVKAAQQAETKDTLLVVDEINRADLGKVLGEAIYLFEPREVGEKSRTVQLPHKVGGSTSFSLPDKLFVVATMNTADRSIAPLDLAIRRRFAFVTVPPQRDVVVAQKLELAIDVFDRLADVFTEHAPGEAVHLMPGHAYFLAKSEAELRRRFRFELIPLLDEYLSQGLLGPAGAELAAVRDWLDDKVDQEHGKA